MATAASQAISTTKSSETESIIGFSPGTLQAPFVLRCAALCVDYMVLLVVPTGWLIWSKFFGESGTNNTGIGVGVWFIGAVILWLINFFCFAAFAGPNAGQNAAGPDGSQNRRYAHWPCDHLVRNIIGYFATVLTLGLGFLISAVNSSGRALHDFIAGTVVVRGNKKRV